MQILKYQGNDNYIIGLAKDNDSEKKFIFFAKIASIILNNEEEEQDAWGGFIKYVSSRKYTIEFLLKLSNDNSFIHLLEIKDEKEYDTVCKILEFAL